LPELSPGGLEERLPIPGKRVIPLLMGVEEVPSLIRQFPYVRYNDLHVYLSRLEQRAKPLLDEPPMAVAY
jgi:hypothetical protein